MKELKEKYPPSGYEMTPKQAQPQPQTACPVGARQGGGQEAACGDLVSCGGRGERR